MNIDHIETKTPETAPQIHGHEVLEMMEASGHPYSVESLKTAIDERFGKEARFYICSGGDMTAQQLIDTLWAKGKFMGTPESFVFDTGRRCNH